MRHSEIADELNRWAKEIDEEIRSEPDEETGYSRFDPRLSEFYSNRTQLNVFEAFFDLMVPIGVDMVEPRSKRLLIERELVAIENMQATLEEHTRKLTELLED